MFLLLIFLSASAYASCPAGTTFDPTFYRCYKYETKAASFFTAEQNCLSLGGHLVSVKSSLENDLLYETAVNVCGMENSTGVVWIGANRLFSLEWSWSDGAAFQYRNWDNEQACLDSQHYCGSMGSGGLWRTEDCKLEFPYICAIPPDAPAQCPLTTTVTTSSVRKTTVPTTTSKKTTIPLRTTVPLTTTKATTVTTTMKTTVPVTTTLKMTVPQTTTLRTTVPVTTTVRTTVPQTTTMGTTVPVTTTQKSTVPQTTTMRTTLPPVTCPPQKNASYCSSEWTYFYESDSCYKVFPGRKFNESETFCRSHGAHLTSIHSKNENRFVTDLASTLQSMSNVFQMTWIGLHNVTGVWEWTDNSQYDPAFYKDFWAKGEPNNNGNERCVELYSDCMGTCQKYFWNDLNCGSDMRAIVCKKPALHI